MTVKRNKDYGRFCGVCDDSAIEDEIHITFQCKDVSLVRDQYMSYMLIILRNRIIKKKIRILLYEKYLKSWLILRKPI